MKKEVKQEAKKDRRSFIKEGLALGSISAAALALGAFQQGQENNSGEKVKLLSPEGEIVEVNEEFLKEIPEVHIPPNEARKGIEGRKFVMVIDLARCKNLRKCQDACEKAHYLTPDKEWLKVLRMQDNPQSAPYWQPTLCLHCDEPPCVKVCPVDATFKRSDGIVLVDTDRCIGCRFCMVACPYSARTFDWDKPDIPEYIANIEYSPENSLPPKMGTVSKCDFCPHMLREGHLPHCVTACPNGVFWFGDENEDTVSNGDKTVRLSQLLKDRAGYRYLEELGTKPRVYYLPPYNRLFPFEEMEDNQPENDH